MQSRYYHTILYPTQARYSHTVLYFFPRPPDLANAIRFCTFSPIRYGERNGSFRAFLHAVMEATITHLRDVWNAVDSRGKTHTIRTDVPRRCIVLSFIFFVHSPCARPQKMMEVQETIPFDILPPLTE